MIRLLDKFLSGKAIVLNNSPYRVHRENSARQPSKVRNVWRQIPSLRKVFKKGGRIDYSAPLYRSPDRRPGILDALRKTARIRSFTLEDTLFYSYFRDIRFVMFCSLALGFAIWWGIAPEPIFAIPQVSYYGPFAELIKEAPLCEGRMHNYLCKHFVPGKSEFGCYEIYKCYYAPGEYFDPFNLYTNSRIDPNVTDPFKLLSSNRAMSLAAMIGAIILAVALSESVTC